ncbi:hypothetical protein Droror1_Dr00019884 [Drosera rotundifolia]
MAVMLLRDTAPAGGVPAGYKLLIFFCFSGLGVGGLNAPSASNVPPEELYATQLSQLQEMGFIDTQENIRALQASHGNVHAAVEDFWVILVSDIRWFFVCFDFSIVWCYQEE